MLAGGAAEKAGLAPGDILVALDGIRIQCDKLDDLVARIPEGDEADVHAFRRDELMRFRVRPLPAPADTCELRILAEAQQEIIVRRAQWLGLPT